MGQPPTRKERLHQDDDIAVEKSPISGQPRNIGTKTALVELTRRQWRPTLTLPLLQPTDLQHDASADATRQKVHELLRCGTKSKNAGSEPRTRHGMQSDRTCLETVGQSNDMTTGKAQLQNIEPGRYLLKQRLGVWVGKNGECGWLQDGHWSAIASVNVTVVECWRNTAITS